MLSMPDSYVTGSTVDPFTKAQLHTYGNYATTALQMAVTSLTIGQVNIVYEIHCWCESHYMTDDDCYT